MKIENDIDYSIISDDIDNITSLFKEYYLINKYYDFDELIKLISNFNQKRIIFVDILRDYNMQEKNKILELLKLRKINFVNITSYIEEVLLADYLYVFSHGKIVLEGNTMDVLKQEKELKGIGFALPFAVDLSTQLKLYGTIDNIESDIGKLVDTLWN